MADAIVKPYHVDENGVETKIGLLAEDILMDDNITTLEEKMNETIDEVKSTTNNIDKFTLTFLGNGKVISTVNLDDFISNIPDGETMLF